MTEMEENLQSPVKDSDMTLEQPLLLIGNPNNRRTLGLQEARQRIGLQPALVLPYDRLLKTWRRGGTMADAVQQCLEGRGTTHVKGEPWISSPASILYANHDLVHGVNSVPLIRLDAPGEEWEVERELLFLGAVNDVSPLIDGLSAGMIPAEQTLTLEQEWGRIYAPNQWFRGWKACLERIRHEALEYWPNARFMNDPHDIAIMFDKRKCQQHLSAHSVHVPPTLQSSEPIRNYADLRTAMKTAGMNRVFVKLACGSGASGVVAYQINPRTGAEIAITTVGMERVQGKVIFYNEGRLRKYTHTSEISALMDWLCAEGAQIERWMAKASLGSSVFDIRQLVAGGQAGHAIVRLSQTPITNLHLRNERLLPAEAGLDEQQMDRVQTTAKAAMAAFPNSWSAGIDVMLSGGTEPRAYILDVNPFGDLLYRVQHNGLGTYEWQMELLRKEPYNHD
ncbi:STM4014 family protein [Paenibacillus marchantiae]|uniref:STM4014 family protein n=1 Tax=Paenibacillus marchantiae TaxID=3026433 RepID=UPI00237AD303|nr:STM4014 family protein [Paenibacillus marchantiae]WDQ32642.1 STM4014 family protein [Paenibacillus marchantiae]